MMGARVYFLNARRPATELRCIVCDGPVEAGLARLGSLTCHDHRDLSHHGRALLRAVDRTARSDAPSLRAA